MNNEKNITKNIGFFFMIAAPYVLCKQVVSDMKMNMR